MILAPFPSISESARANDIKQKILVFKTTKQFAFRENRFHTSECTQSNHNKQRRHNIICCTEGVKYILWVLLCLKQYCIFCFTRFTFVLDAFQGNFSVVFF